MGSKAATAPLTLMTAVRNAVKIMMRTISRVLLSPAYLTSNPPIQVVIPEASIASATTKSAAMRMTVPEPKPEKASSMLIIPVANKSRATPRATISTGSLFQTKMTFVIARIISMVAISVILTG